MTQLELPRFANSHLSPASLMERVDLLRLDASRRLDPKRQAAHGQFLTPTPVARLMAGMFAATGPTFHFVDPGAGIGSLSAALVAELVSRPKNQRPQRIEVVAYEIDELLREYLADTLVLCRDTCSAAGVQFDAQVSDEEFVCAGVHMLVRDAYEYRPIPEINGVILNPPYKKINIDSPERRLLRRVGMETSNLYTAFVTVAGKLLAPGGELVAITPRSFCNGTYFRPFRRWLLDDLALMRFHVFESRTSAFQDDSVLQENVVFHAVRGTVQPAEVTVSSSADPTDEAFIQRPVAFERVVSPSDPDYVIRLVADNLGDWVTERMGHFNRTLDDLGLEVSTGRVVDFRATAYLRDEMESDPLTQGHMPTVPLIYPGHLDGWVVAWPRPNGRKHNVLAIDSYTGLQTVPGGIYVLTRRFTAKEERRRVVAAIYDPDRVGWCGRVGFENHLNYYHKNGTGLPLDLAHGLAAFLNSTLVDEFFRQFNGHTQVNATDLRSLRYPGIAILQQLGECVGTALAASNGALDQHALDEIIDQELFGMAETATGSVDPVAAKRRIDEAMAILAALGFPNSSARSARR